MSNIRVFISYYHKNDQGYKNELITLNKQYHMFIDNSVDIGDIDDEYMTDEQIRVKIRDEYIKDSDVLILLCGRNSKHRKHIDWELHAAMYKSDIKEPIPIIVLNLPSARNGTRKTNDLEKGIIERQANYSVNWTSFSSYSEYKNAYPDLPERLLQSLANKNTPIAIVNYSRLYTSEIEKLVQSSYSRKSQYTYDDSEPLRRRDGVDE